MLFGTEQLSWMLEVHNSACLAFTVVVEVQGDQGLRGSLQSSRVAVCLTPLRDTDCKNHGLLLPGPAGHQVSELLPRAPLRAGTSHPSERRFWKLSPL